MPYPNLAVMHRDVARRLGNRTAVRFKQSGVYRDVTWTNYRWQADRAAAGLIELGIQPGDRVGLLSENRYEWLVADVGILSAAAADVPLHAPLSAAQVEYQLGHSGCRGVIVSNQAQADKVLSVLETLPDLEFLVSFDDVDCSGRLRHITWDGLLQRGGDAARETEVLAREALLNRDSLATIIYTSGTTGNPKGVMLSHGNLVSNAETMQAIMPSLTSDILLSWLPYSHIYARTVDHYLSVISEIVLCVAESINTLLVNLQELQPTWITSVPRFYEKVWGEVEHLPVDERNQALHDIFGPRMRRLTSGGAPLPAHVSEGFIDAGLPLYEGYGLTESSPVISFNYEGSQRIRSVGRAIPEVDIKIAEDGEILTRGPHVMLGYWKNPTATAETIVNGWLLTGDVGRIDDDGFLFITDRKKDLIITSGGKNIAPSVLERLLVSDPCIDHAVVYGDAKPFVTALLVPNLKLLAAKAAELGCEIETRGAYIISPRLNALLAERVQALMQAVSKPEQVKKVLLLAHPLNMEAGDLTASLKVRRRAIVEKYRAELDALYAEPSDCG